MKSRRRITLSAVALFIAVAIPRTQAIAEEVPGSETTLFRMVGQVTNSAPGVTPATSNQYGYLTYLRGFEHLFAKGGHDEATALFTFFASATTTSVVTSGNLRTIVRTGTTTLYLNLIPHGNFADPKTFRDGMPIQTSSLQQQVVVNIPTGAFRTVNVNTIESALPFTLGNRDVRLGTVGEVSTTFLVGQLHSPSPPSGYFSGFALEGSGTFATTSPSGVSAVSMLAGSGGTGVTASIVVSFAATLAGDGMVLFGSGPGCTGLIEVATRDLFRQTTNHAVVVVGNDLPGTVGDNGIQPGATYWYEVVSVSGGISQIDDNQGRCYRVTVPEI